MDDLFVRLYAVVVRPDHRETDYADTVVLFPLLSTNQQILGNCSPASIVTTRSPPISERITTMPW